MEWNQKTEENYVNSYYSDCLNAFHELAGYDVVKTGVLEKLDTMVVKRLMTNKRVLSDLANDHAQFQCVILCRSVQCGAVFAKLFQDDIALINDTKELEKIIDNPEMHSAIVINEVLRMSAETFYLDSSGALHFTWLNIESDGIDENQRLAECGLAAYQLGVSMALSNLGY